MLLSLDSTEVVSLFRLAVSLPCVLRKCGGSSDLSLLLLLTLHIRTHESAFSRPNLHVLCVGFVEAEIAFSHGGETKFAERNFDY